MEAIENRNPYEGLTRPERCLLSDEDREARLRDTYPEFFAIYDEKPEESLAVPYPVYRFEVREPVRRIGSEQVMSAGHRINVPVEVGGTEIIELLDRDIEAYLGKVNKGRNPETQYIKTLVGQLEPRINHKLTKNPEYEEWAKKLSALVELAPQLEYFWGNEE